MRYLITSALPYINGVKHLGNLVGSMLPSDVYARYLRQEGHEVLFICATDDHGTPAELGALEAGMDVAEYCQVQYEKQRSIYEQFGLSFDYFGRSSSPDNHELTQQIYQELDANGYIEEREISQLYSVDDQRFLPDRYVTGTCPICGYESARGDQCENCTSMLNPTELINPRSTISGGTNLEERQTTHLYLKLSTLAPQVREWVESHHDWPKLTTSIALKWLDEGLKDRGITRDLNWGVPVPRPGFEDKVFYVWFDAPIAYISTTKTWARATGHPDAWREWWMGGKDIQYTQFMAKDNVPFHTVFWPAVMLGTKEPWHLADYIKSFNWLTYYGSKFSTSQHYGVFTDQALELLPADYWRYALIANAPESSDAAFTWELLQSKVNSELAGKYGNFINRTLKLTASKFGNIVPDGGTPGKREAQLQADCDRLVKTIDDHYQKLEFRKACEAIRALWDIGNGYFDEQQPWTLVKTDPDTAAMVLRTCMNLIRLYAIATAPLMPDTSAQILAALHAEASSLESAAQLDTLPANATFDDLPVLFTKIEDETIVEYKDRFGAPKE